MSSAQTRLPLSPSGTSPATIRCARPSTIAVFPTPGSPISTGLFFVRRDRTWITRRISSSRPMTGSSLPCSASSVRSRPNFSSAWYVPSGSWDVTRWPPRTSFSLASNSSRGTTSSASRRCSVETNSSSSLRISSSARSRTRENAVDAPGCCAAPCSEGRRARSASAPARTSAACSPSSVCGSSWSRSASSKCVGNDLRIAAAARELLRGGDRLLRFDRQPLEVHLLGTSSTPVGS